MGQRKQRDSAKDKYVAVVGQRHPHEPPARTAHPAIAAGAHP